MSKSTELQSTAQKLASVAPLVSRVEQVEARLLANKAEQVQAHRSLLPKTEMTEHLLAWLLERRERFERVGTPNSGAVAMSVVTALSATPRRPIDIYNEVHLLDLLMWLLWPALEQSAPEAIARLNYEEGIPSAERAKRRAALDEERTRLVAEHERLVEEVNQQGQGVVTLKHLPEVSQRRYDDKVKRDREESQRRRQEQLSREIEQRG